MCMIVKSISELTDSDNKELLDEAKALMNSVEERFAEIIDDAMQLGEVDSAKNSMELARYMQVQIIGLRTYSRVNDDKTIINNFIDDIFVGAPFH